MRSWIKRGTGLAIVLYCLIPILVVARGGGGGHSSGGSSSGGSYGGGGSSGGVFFLGGGGGGGGFVTYVILFVMLLVLVFAIKSKIQSSGSFKASQYVPLAEGENDSNVGLEAIKAKEPYRPFTEYWTFQRSAGAKTLVTGGVTDKKCPNCGAPLDVNATGNCKYCGEVVTSGKFDWVLSKIDQANEWRG